MSYDYSWLGSLEYICRKYEIAINLKSYIRNYSGRDLDREQIRIPKFDSQEAFKIGTSVSNSAKRTFPNRPVVIDISLPNGYCLFRVITNIGSSLDDENWIKRNRETAMRYGCSSFFMGLKFKLELEYNEKKYFPDSKEYAFDGGALPIFTDSCEFPVACLTISGLEEYENHWLAVEAVRDYVTKIQSQSAK